MSLETPAVASRRAAVRPSDRLWDLAALVLLAGGTLLFAVGRQSLKGLAQGTYQVPAGVTWVSRAERHDAQTRWGGGLVAAGLVAGIAAASRHVLARRFAR
jgi:hypothetical protein